MKIIHIFPYSARASGGHSNAIVEFIACQRATGLDVIGLSPLPPEDIHNGTLPAAGVREMDFTDPTFVNAEIIRIADHQPAVMHVHAVNRFTGRLVEYARKAGLAVVLTSHGQLNFRNALHAVEKLFYLSFISPQVRHSDGIHVLTQKARQRLRLIIPGYKGLISVLPHTIHEPPVDDGHGEHPQSPEQCMGKPFTLIYLGRLDVRTKGLDLLLEGFAKARLHQAKLVLAGPDWQNGRTILEKLSRALGCAHQVEFPGAVYGADKERLLASADLYVAASRWDAFNISLAEALRREIPTVVSEGLHLAQDLAAAGGAEVVACSAPAIANAIRVLSRDADRRRTIASHGKAWVIAHCSQEQVGAGFAAFYEKVLIARLGVEHVPLRH
jgi:glycosyltransferase involved in cell wall biosynthesis